jgi:hypothetical protein
MPSCPPKILEDLAKILIPPACREEVLGDLYERYKSPSQYLADLLSTLPFLILGRIRRTTSVWLLLMDALIIYGTFLAVAWFLARGLVTTEGGLVRLAIPSGLTLVTLLIGDAFPVPRRRPASGWIRSLLIGLPLIALCDVVGLETAANLFGYFLSVVLVSLARVMFELHTGQPLGAGGPALLAGRESRPVSRTLRVTMTLIFLAITCLIWWEIVSKKGIHP